MIKTEVPRQKIEQIHPSLAMLSKRDFIIMGIVNVTPDSFFDGGHHATTTAAFDHARMLIEQGADVLDIGGESSRPGASPVSTDEEKRRILPLIEQLRQQFDIPISVDTTKSEIAELVLASGATWINDISAGRMDANMASTVAKYQCPIILMHSRKDPQTMQTNPLYDDVVREVQSELLGQVDLFIKAGVKAENILLDPGIGFAKRFEDNCALLRQLDQIAALGYPLCVGTSRKSFIGTILQNDVQDRLYGSLGSLALAHQKGAQVYRVHDVLATKDFLTVLSKVASS